MSLPDQEMEEQLSDRLYTATEVEHLLARKMAAKQLAQLESGQLDLHKRLVDVVASFNAKFENLTNMISAQPAHVESCKVELRREIERDFPNRLEALQMEQRIEVRVAAVDDKVDKVDGKVEKMWLKIVVPISTIVAISSVATVLMNYYLFVSKVLG